MYTKAKTPRQMAGQPARDLTGRARPAQPAPQFRGAAQPFGAAPQFQPTADPSAATPRGQLVADDLQARSSVATPRTQAARVDRAKKCSGEGLDQLDGVCTPGMGEQIAETLRDGSGAVAGSLREARSRDFGAVRRPPHERPRRGAALRGAAAAAPRRV